MSDELSTKDKLLYILANCDDLERLEEGNDELLKCIHKIKQYAQEIFDDIKKN